MNRVVAALLPLIASAAAWGQSANWAPSAPELERIEAGAIITEGEVTTARAVDIRAAISVNATAEQVFHTLTDCAVALRFVPHLKRCKVIETAPDGSWQNVEQRVDYGWLAPRADYVFHAEYEKFDRIRFSNVSGDFRENRGVWTFRPLAGSTLVTYEAHVAPDFYVPRWLMRKMLKRDLPDLMRGLRTHAEALRSADATSAPAPPSP